MTSSKLPPKGGKQPSLDSSDEDLRSFLENALNQEKKPAPSPRRPASPAARRPPQASNPNLQNEMAKVRAEMANTYGGDQARVKVTGKDKARPKGKDDDRKRLTSSDIFGSVIDEIEGRTPVEEPEFRVNHDDDVLDRTAKEAAGADFLQAITEDTGPVQPREPAKQPPPARPPAAQAPPKPPAPQGTAAPRDPARIYTTRELPPENVAESARNASTPLPSGKALAGTNEYQLISKIASGGMAEVWKAKLVGEKGFEKIVAVKKILSHLGGNDEFISMFIDEARVAANLTHPNIAQIYELGKMDESFFIAMEYVSGQNLRTLLNQCVALGMNMAPEIVAYITMKMCNALHYAHQKKDYDNRDLNIVHRDVSPQNILISNEGEIKLVDFGIAKASIKASETIAGSLKGKLLYMSPEQADGKPIDRRSDIFSLGSVMYECLTGRKIFGGDSEMSILKNVRQASFTPARQINPNIPPGLDAIMSTILTREPSQRYATAKQLENDLKNFLKQEKFHINESDVAEYMRLVIDQDLTRLSGYGPKVPATPPPARPATPTPITPAPAAPPVAKAPRPTPPSAPVTRDAPPPRRATGQTAASYRPAKPQPPAKPKKKSGSALMVVSIIVLVAALAVIGYALMRGDNTTAVRDGGSSTAQPANNLPVPVDTDPSSDGALSGGDPTSGDPASGDPASGDPSSGDPAAGDPTSGDPPSGDPVAGGSDSDDPAAATVADGADGEAGDDADIKKLEEEVRKRAERLKRLQGNDKKDDKDQKDN